MSVHELTRRSSRRRERIMSSWNHLVTAALLGTDRRDPPVPPPGPIADAVSDLALVAGDESADVRLLNQVAVTTIARRASTRPQASVARLAPPPVETRPLCSAAAAESWRRIVGQWPVLEDEWLALAWQHGVSLPGDLVVDLLERHRRDPARTAVIAAIAGDVVPWLSEHVPSVGRYQPSAHAVDPCVLPPLPIAPSLEPLLLADGSTFSGTLVAELVSGQLTAMHRPVLLNLIARCRTIVLDDLIDAMSALAETDGVAASLVELARCRRDMLLSFTESSCEGSAP
jgi:hypothetical protein